MCSLFYMALGFSFYTSIFVIPPIFGLPVSLTPSVATAPSFFLYPLVVFYCLYIHLPTILFNTKFFLPGPFSPQLASVLPFFGLGVLPIIVCAKFMRVFDIFSRVSRLLSSFLPFSRKSRLPLFSVIEKSPGLVLVVTSFP